MSGGCKALSRLLTVPQIALLFELNLEEEVVVELLRSIFHQAPEIALFASLFLGYWVGKFRFGSFQLGGVAGSLLAAVLISQVGVTIDSGIKTVLFALFIYAVGFESGPQFFRSIHCVIVEGKSRRKV